MSDTPKKRAPIQTIADQEQADSHKIRTQSDVRIRMDRIHEDFEQGFELLRREENTVTFFGSARLEPDHKYYQQARRLAARIVQELDATIVTGGGSGIMAAANQGAKESHGKSVGMSIELPCEQVTNAYVDESVDFYYFFSRKVALSFTARAFIYFPGGFGTLDEFFEILTLKQTRKIKPLPIILYGREYWEPLLDFIKNTLSDKFETIGPDDCDLFRLTDSHDEVIDILRERNINSN